MFSVSYKKSLTHLFLIIAFGLLAYSNTFNVPFQWDEAYFLDPVVKDLSYFSSPSNAEGLAFYNPLKSRYVGYLTFALNYKIHGFKVTGYHFVNLTIHLLSALLVYYFALLTYRTPFLKNSILKGYSNYIALFSGILFVSHPIQTEAVTYVFQRFASLSAMFYLLSVVFYAKWRLTIEDEGIRAPELLRRPKVLLYFTSLLSFLLAIKTKENAFTLPLALALYDYLFFPGKFSKKALYLLPFFLLAIFFIPVATTPSDAIDDLSTIGFKELPKTVYLFTEFRVIVTYLRLLFLPINQNIDYDYPVFSSLLNIEVFLSLIALIFIVLLGFYLLNRSKSEPALRIASFGIFWFFIALSVESSIIPLPMFINEYRLYLPSIGAFFAISTAFFLFFERSKTKIARTALVISFILLPALLSYATYERNSVWKSRISLWKDAVEKSPEKSRTRSNLGLAYMSDRQGKAAIEEFIIALKLSEKYANNPYKRKYQAKLHFDLGHAYSSEEAADDAVRHYELAIGLMPDYIDAHYALGVLYWAKGVQEKAEGHLRAILDIKPDFLEARYKSALELESKNMFDEAMERYLEIVKLKPGFANAHYHLGVIYYTKKQLDKAIEQYLLALKYKPNDSMTHGNLGIAYAASGNKAKATEHLKTAIKLEPQNPDHHFNLAYFYLENGFPDGARREFEEVLRLNPGDPKARQLLNSIK